MDARAIIARLRDRQRVDADALRWFAQGLSDRGVSDAQAGAFAMAVLLNGLDAADRVALTLAMRDSGDVLHWSLDRPVIDKHSTGGVGDCVSLVLAPALAACGAAVPMISGRGLGHTGGTLDKLEAIPGFATELDEARLRTVVTEAGCAIVAASHRIAPADKRLYAVRDVTATVESLDLITASILSKKLAAGLQGLVLDVKTGSGAFMKTVEEARALAHALVETANSAGCPTSALITDMTQPLAPALGNALEVAAAMRVLTGAARGRLFDLSVALGAEALVQGGLATDATEGAAQVAQAIDTGAAADTMGRMVAAQGGPLAFVGEWARFLPEAPVIREVPAPMAGHVTAMDGEALGLAVVALGGGRQVETDRVDPAVGLSDVVSLGDRVDRGQPLARIHAAREDAAEASLRAVQAAITLGHGAPGDRPLVLERVGP
ncbi:thymidine phosphorylase [Lutimaribacter sp. EGI FJ00015]|uniref:Thymidine phosphorylase n=1 Tax=Lutimaribacter degradans TaxID=2945989 RepID=A0ACC5ZU27_9RHOB|nr:thymidine phosphorylase [Lutimaribacter sp. EGI FJ00013]MCM2561453.1 thymidine phosphorylase [Lutimaribacter sp. EGI FJ00013]MCO0612837.1 thymidine phosphorylase [Lutimaribacter sp. EGI FJ00015]MCO0635495.1 thymidine phosphorylase [Lutimaribacter sp. EGI FJ00014]